MCGETNHCRQFTWHALRTITQLLKYPVPQCAEVEYILIEITQLGHIYDNSSNIFD